MTGRGLQTLEQALAQLLAQASQIERTETLPLAEADGRVLAKALVAELDVPGFDNSQMDGYAVDSKSVVDGGGLLRVSQRIAAGHFGVALESNTAARIFTGAPMPLGADCVVMQEDCVQQADGSIRIQTVPASGQWVRKRAEDVAVGQTVLPANTVLGPAQLGLAAGLGVASLQVRCKPRVALFSTGDELITPGTLAPADLPLGAIFNSNRYFLRALLERFGAVVVDLGVVPDTLAATLAALESAAAQADVIVTSGGVSVGEEDHVKPAVEQLGSLDLWQIGMKPGKPFAHGRVVHAHFMGLPGNPVSSFVTALLLIRPFLRVLQGLEADEAPRREIAIALADGPKSDKRREFLRGRLDVSGNRLGVRLYPNQNSSVLTSMHWADVLVDNPAQTQIRAGDLVSVLRLDALMNLYI